MPSVSEFQKSVIALACWNAVAPEPHQAALLACMVFRNRAQAGWFDGDLYENCSRWLVENPPDEYPDGRDPAFQEFLAKLDGVVVGLVPDRTGGALYFARRDQVEKVAGQVVSTFGNLLFVA